MPRRFIYKNGNDANLTPAQRESLEKIADRWSKFEGMEEIVVEQMVLSDCVMISVGSMGEFGSGMVIGVEADGYTHS